MFGSGFNKVVSKAIGNMQLPVGVLGALTRGLTGSIDQRQAFTSVLLATVAHVNQKKNFNLELEINDLWIRLSNLRQADTGSPLGNIMTGVSNLINTGLNDHLKKSIESVLTTLKK